MPPQDCTGTVAQTGLLVQISRTKPLQPNKYKLRKFLSSDRDYPVRMRNPKLSKSKFKTWCWPNVVVMLRKKKKERSRSAAVAEVTEDFLRCLPLSRIFAPRVPEFLNKST